MDSSVMHTKGCGLDRTLIANYTGREEPSLSSSQGQIRPENDPRGMSGMYAVTDTAGGTFPSAGQAGGGACLQEGGKTGM